MKKCYTLLFSLLSLSAYGQVQKGKYLATGTLQLRSFYDGDDRYKTLHLGIQNKTGRFLANNIVVGLMSEYSWTHKKTSQLGALQQGSGQWFERGVYNRHEYAVGLFADKYFRFSSKLFITAGLFGQYYRFSDVEVGEYVDQNGNGVGVSYTRKSYPSKVAQLGVANSLVYFLNDRFGVNCLISSLDIAIYKKNTRRTEFDFRVPVMHFGIQYHFPK